MKRSIIHTTCLLLLFGVCLQTAQARTKEITYPSKEFAKLDTFEGLTLQDADKLFLKKDYKGAYAAYKAYSVDFDKSKALGYVLLRMGRCLQLLDKRNAAIKAYQDVVDYFPDDVRYAAAALYYIGDCHRQNGDTAKQTAVWARMVKDDDYVTQANSGTALAFLGGAMSKLGKHDEAAQYNWRTAIAFLKSNPNAAKTARNAVIHHYVTRNPNHDKLKEFYVACSGFDGHGRKTNKPQEDTRYWSTVLHTAVGVKGESRSKVCKYWAAKMGSSFADNDDLRKQLFDVQMAYENDRKLWMERLTKQFSTKPLTIKRVLHWCNYMRFDKKAMSAFFDQHGRPMVAGMKTNEKIDLMNRLWHPLGMHDEIRAVLAGVSLQGLTDADIKKVAVFAERLKTEEDVMRYYGKMKDKLFATKCRFDYYNGRSHRNKPYMEKALAEIPALSKSPKYAPGLDWSKATLLYGLGRYDEAIKAYNAANKQPDSTWGVTNCLIAMKDYARAIKTVRQLESLGGGVAAKAALRAADIYKLSGNKGKEVQQLRLVLKRYPKSGESSTAHNRLESYGVALTGGEAEAEE